MTGSQEDTLTGGQGYTDWKSGGIGNVAHKGCGDLVGMEVRVFGLGRIGVEDRSGQVEVGQDKDWDGQL